MKDFLYDMLIKPFSYNDMLGYVIGISMWLLSLFLIILLLWLSVWLIDSSFMPIKEKEGIVKNKYIVPAHTTTNYVQSGELSIPVTTHHETSYKLEISIDGLTDDIGVYESYYYNISVGEKVHCKYTNGRIKKSLYIKSLE